MIVCGGFSCPCCYLAGHRVDALHVRGVEIDWRAVERCPQLPVDGSRSGAGPRLEAEMREITGPLGAGEDLPSVMPSFVPNTEAAVSAYAEAYGAGVADPVRRLLFTLCWVEGADIWQPERVAHPARGSGPARTLNRRPAAPIWLCGQRRPGPDHDHRLAPDPSLAQRMAATRSAGPAYLLDGGATLSAALARRLAKEMGQVDALPSPVLDDPRQYSRISVHPQTTWVSVVGGRWAHDYM